MSAALLLATRALLDRPVRTLALLVGYGVGVAVMILLLSVGRAIVLQAEDRDITTGGDVVLLPAGLDPEILKLGGVVPSTAAIPNARYLVRQVLRGPRFAGRIAAAAPRIEGHLVYLRRNGRLVAATADAGIPSLDRAAGVPGAQEATWRDADDDRRWIAPTPDERLAEIDHFHAALMRPDWAEWHYFNLADPSGSRYAYLTFLAGGVCNGVREGAVILQVRERGRPPLRAAFRHPLRDGDTSTASADVRVGPNAVTVRDGSYRIRVREPGVRADLVLTPAPGLYFPPYEIEREGFVSGYVVPALRASVRGAIDFGGAASSWDGAVGYHDHNWGIWRRVTWEWGQASTPGYALLYGVVRSPDLEGDQAPLLVLMQAGEPGGVLAFFRPQIRLSGWHRGPRLPGGVASVPREISLAGRSGAGDRITVRIILTEAVATPSPDAGKTPRGLPQAFLQMRGTYQVEATIDGKLLRFAAPGAAETYAPIAPH